MLLARGDKSASQRCNLVFTLTAAGGLTLLVRVKRQSQKAAFIPSARWTAYALAGLATVPGLVATADAEIHYSGRIRFHLGYGDTLLPLSGGASLLFAHFFGSSNNYNEMWIVGAGEEGVATDPTSFLFAAAKFHPRVNVSTAGHFNSYAWLVNTFDDGHWTDRGKGIAAFEFNTGEGVQYGWVRIRTTQGGGVNRLEIIDYAWADPGEPILTGQTQEGVAPEADAAEESTAAKPARKGSLGLLALGAIGLQARHHSRSAKAGPDAPQ